MMIAALVILALALLYGAMTALNMVLFRTPARVSFNHHPRVSLLIPARNEADHIDAALEAALASRDVELEVLVLDDASDDDTAERVAARAETDHRLRLIRSAPLPGGWNGKQYACAQLAEAARHDILVFIDADVRLGPKALSRACAHLRRHNLQLTSGFPRERTESAAETLLVPMIHVLLLGYLPLAFARVSSNAGLAAGCGQFMVVARDAYQESGGHAAVRTTMHDGLRLPRVFRRAGFKTDIFDASKLVECRMYRGFAEAWQGFSKNATEGMATPIALPIWTALLAGGHVAPFVLLIAALIAGAAAPAWLAAIAIVSVWTTRAALAWRYRQRAIGVLLHPVAIMVMLALQWRALFVSRRSRVRTWRGRTYSS